MEFPSWQMHRGYWKKGVRENTMAAFQQAFAADAQMVEMDVQISRDGIPHVFHDYSLKKMFHVDQWVNKTSHEDLKSLNVPTLKEVLESELVPEYFNIEIKSIDFVSYRIARKVYETIISTKHSKKFLVSSFNPMVLHWFFKFDPDIPRALIVGDINYFMGWKFNWAMKLAKPDFINCHYKIIDEEESRARLIGYKKPVMVWTVNDWEKAQFYLTRGAKSVISDDLPQGKLDS